MQTLLVEEKKSFCLLTLLVSGFKGEKLMEECLRENTGCCFSEVPDLQIHKGTDSSVANCGFGSEQGSSGHEATRQHARVRDTHTLFLISRAKNNVTRVDSQPWKAAEIILQ